MAALFAFLTPGARDAGDPLVSVKTTAAWLRELPSLDVVARQQLVMRDRPRCAVHKWSQGDFHFSDRLPQDFFRIFALVDQIVEIGANQRRNTFHESHDFLQSSPRLFHREFWLIRRRCDCRFV